MKNTGAASQTSFEDLFLVYGKKAFLYRVTDTKEIRGLNKKKGIYTKPQPSDYVVTLDGEMFYAEVKSTNQKRWARSKFEERIGQRNAMVQQIAAGGEYRLYLHFILTDNWYILPGRHFLSSTNKSWSEDDLVRYRIQNDADPIHRRNGGR